MAESIVHINYVRKIAEYTSAIIPVELIPHLLIDLPESYRKPDRTIGNFLPDLYYKDLKYLIIGEAKTENDIDRKHSINQYKSYIEEASLFHGEKHILICTSLYSYARIKNLIKKLKLELNTTAKFHLLNDLGDITII